MSSTSGLSSDIEKFLLLLHLTTFILISKPFLLILYLERSEKTSASSSLGEETLTESIQLEVILIFNKMKSVDPADPALSVLWLPGRPQSEFLCLKNNTGGPQSSRKSILKRE